MEFANAVSAGIKEKVPCELEIQDTSFIKPGGLMSRKSTN